jgi:hypothetical protein
MRLPPSSPRIVAEALEHIADPIVTALRTGPVAPVAAVARAIAASLLPAQADPAPPAWLLPSQRVPFRRAMYALEHHRGVLLALAVGSGKTWLALALAQHLNADGITSVLAPAPLRGHWLRTAGSLGVPIDVSSHARASRGRLPSGGGVVIIDESHHFRTPLTRRYATVAPWLTGRCALLLSATPVVNRLEDLGAQLRLAVRDDALATSGVGSLSLLLGNGLGHPALADLVIA